MGRRSIGTSRRRIGDPLALAWMALVAMVAAAHGASAQTAPGSARSLDIDQAPFDAGRPDALLGGGWQAQRLYGYQGPAGVYSCAPGQVGTNLARQACGGTKFPNRFF